MKLHKFKKGQKLYEITYNYMKIPMTSESYIKLYETTETT